MELLRPRPKFKIGETVLVESLPHSPEITMKRELLLIDVRRYGTDSSSGEKYWHYGGRLFAPDSDTQSRYPLKFVRSTHWNFVRESRLVSLRIL